MRIPNIHEMRSRPLTEAELVAGELLPKVLWHIQSQVRLSSRIEYPLPYGMVPGSRELLISWLRPKWIVEESGSQALVISPR